MLHMQPKQSRYHAAMALLSAIAALLLVSSCRPTVPQSPPLPPLLEQAYTQGEQDQWPNVLPLAKEYLRTHPNDSGAHFLLGQSYLRRATPYFLLAEGEFYTALDLFHTQPPTPLLQKYETAERYRAAILRELARTAMRRAYAAAQHGPFPTYVHEQLEKAQKLVQKARQYDPKSPYLIEMEEQLKKMLPAPSTSN